MGKRSIYNLGNGGGFSNRQVIAAVEKVTGRQLPVEVAPRREGDAAILVASSGNARKELG
jgi:UDP-glucose 4-epimerase